jgi:transcriptional regulator with XRE-family HTH domain
MEILAERMLLLRKEKKLRQSDIATALDIGLYTYQRYEYAEREPSASCVKAIADFYDVSADYLLGRKDER